jgi:uncharacterized membrane protein YedE/YeeE
MLILIFGFAFGALMQYARVNRFNVISGMATLEDFTVMKVMAFAIGIGAPLIALEAGLGFASYHIKPIVLGGLIWGGLIFGTGMAILGYCPGTLAISLGQGSIDALFGIIGGLLGGFVFTLLYPTIQAVLGPDLGAISLYSNIGEYNFAFYAIILIFSAVIIWCVFAVQKKEKSKDYKWIYTGVGLAILNGLMLLTISEGRPIGASTAFPYVADILTGLSDHEYFLKIQSAGAWEAIFLGGSFLAGLIFSLSKKEFELKLIYSQWEKYHGNNPTKRIIWSLVGGFLLIFGARMAGGCTSGHILSGGMQLAKSSMVFAAFVFLAFLLTGKLFYSKSKTYED